jgi:hypothetical protein
VLALLAALMMGLIPAVAKCPPTLQPACACASSRNSASARTPGEWAVVGPHTGRVGGLLCGPSLLVLGNMRQVEHTLASASAPLPAGPAAEPAVWRGRSRPDGVAGPAAKVMGLGEDSEKTRRRLGESCAQTGATLSLSLSLSLVALSLSLSLSLTLSLSAESLTSPCRGRDPIHHSPAPNTHTTGRVFGHNGP